MEVIKFLEHTVVIHIVFILLSGWLCVMLAQRFTPAIAEKISGRYRLYILGTVPVLRLIIIILAAWLIISRIIEPNFENLIALVGAIGIALGFAFKDYLSSLIAGIVTLYEMPYRIGDWITVAGTYGEVQAIGMRAVSIVTPDDTTVIIPHQKLWNELLFNANDGHRNLQCVSDFYLHPLHDAVNAKAILHNVGLSSPYLQVQKPVSVIVLEKPWGTHYRLKAYPVDPRDQFAFTTDLAVRGKAALAQAGMHFVTRIGFHSVWMTGLIETIRRVEIASTSTDINLTHAPALGVTLSDVGRMN